MKKALTILIIITIMLTIYVVKGAENTIIIYSSAEQYRNDEMQKQLNEVFPQYNVQVIYMSTGKLAAKIEVEKERTDADIIVALETSYLEKIQENLENVADLSRLEYKELSLNDRYVLWEKQSGSVIINEEVIEKNHLPVPKTYSDLLNPVYHSLIAMPDPKSSGTGYFFMKGLVNQWGEIKTFEYFDQLAQNIKQFTESGSGPIKLLKQGEIAIGLGLTFQGISELNAGNNFLILEPEFGAPYSLTGTSVIKGKLTEPVREVFDYLINDFLIYDKEYFSPGQILQQQRCKIKNYPIENYADMTGIESIGEKERLLALWKY